MHVLFRSLPSLIAAGTSFCCLLPTAANAALSCSGSGLSGVGSWVCTETVVLPASFTDFTATLALDKWNASAANGFVGSNLDWSLGSVNWSVGSSLTASGTLRNNSNASSTLSVQVVEQMTFSNGAGAPSDFLTGPAVLNATSAVQTFSNVASGATVAISPINLNLGPLSGGTLHPDASWTGSGSFSAQVDTQTGLNFAGAGGNLRALIDIQASPSVTLTYTGVSAVHAVPEPATWVSLGAGLLGLCGIVRRRR